MKRYTVEHLNFTR